MIAVEVLQAVLLIAMAPLMSGIVSKLKAGMQNRPGAGVLQPYRDLFKLCRKGGTASYTELCETAGLRTPFEEGSVKAIAQPVANWIAEHQI